MAFWAAGPSRVTIRRKELLTWSAAFARENISSGFLFALETAQGAKFDAGEWMITKLSVFG